MTYDSYREQRPEQRGPGDSWDPWAAQRRTGTPHDAHRVDDTANPYDSHGRPWGPQQPPGAEQYPGSQQEPGSQGYRVPQQYSRRSDREVPGGPPPGIPLFGAPDSEPVRHRSEFPQEGNAHDSAQHRGGYSPSAYDTAPFAGQRPAEPPPPAGRFDAQSSVAGPHDGYEADGRHARTASPAAEPQMPAPLRGQDNADDVPFWTRVRWEIASSLRSANSDFALKAYASLATAKPLSPHMVSLFYAQRDPRQPGGVRLYTVSRWALSDRLTSDLPRFLDELAAVTVKFAAAATTSRRRWDPRGPDKPLVNRGELDMPQDTTFAGVGVGTLDTIKGDWSDQVSQAHAGDPNRRLLGFELPGEAVALIGDGSILRVVRDVNLPFGHSGITSSHSMDVDQPLMRTHSVLSQLGPRLSQAWPSILTLYDAVRSQYEVT